MMARALALKAAMTRFAVKRHGLILATLLCLVCLGVMTTGCSSMKAVRLHSGASTPFGPLRAGDEVTVVTRDGRTVRFVVAEIAGEEIVARSGGRYHRDDILRLERKTFSLGKTALLAGGIYLAVAAVVGLAFAAAFS